MSYRYIIPTFFVFIFAFLSSESAFSQNVNDVARDIVDSTDRLPALLSGIAYLAGLLIATTGILKIVEHVSAPTQTPLRVPIVRLLIGGALFALPMVIEAALVTIGGTTVSTFNPMTNAVTSVNSMMAALSSLASLGGNLNTVMTDTMASLDEVPAVIAAVSFLLALLFIVSALFKIRDHVEDPNRVPLKDSIIRLLVAGALLALPNIYEAMFMTIAGSGLGFGGTAIAFLSGAQFLYSTDVGILGSLSNAQCATSLLGSSLSTVICFSLLGTIGLPVFLTGVAYLLGLVFGLWGLLKIRDHVTDPSRVPLNEGITRLFAGGAFFALPYLTVVFMNTITPATLLGSIAIGGAQTTTGFAEDLSLSCGTSNSLDEAMGCFMADILGPMHSMTNFFCFVAGLIFVMIGISRLIKSAQEGARGPGGLGTVTTFFIGGILMSATIILRAFSQTMFGDTQTSTNASLSFTGGMSATETEAAYHVISAVIKFMIVIGIISFVRGIFIVRDVAEGKQQASLMSGMTHIIGGALAVNLGPLLNAIQETLGVTAFGVAFS